MADHGRPVSELLKTGIGVPADVTPPGNLSFEEAAACRGVAKALNPAALADYREAVRINPTAEKGIADRMREALLKRDEEGP